MHVETNIIGRPTRCGATRPYPRPWLSVSCFKLIDGDQTVHWIVDDTEFPMKGRQSAGVARQDRGQADKKDYCRVEVSLSIATGCGSLPVGYPLYLPRQWAGDEARRDKTVVPEEVGLNTRPELARQQLEAALAAG